MEFNPTPSEMEILTLIWEFGPSKVKKINDVLNENSEKKIGYTTTLKLMQIMIEKKLLNRVKDGSSHIYSVATDQESSQKQLVKKLIDTVFGGSKLNLVMQLLDNRKTDKKEIEEIYSFLNKIKEDQNSKK
jgi:predicted transcriptional regulator